MTLISLKEIFGIRWATKRTRMAKVLLVEKSVLAKSTVFLLQPWSVFIHDLAT